MKIQDHTTSSFAPVILNLIEYSVQFHQLYNVTFIGYSQKTMLNCGNKAGMSFTESEGIHLENLIFDQCGALHDSDFCQCHK